MTRPSSLPSTWIPKDPYKGPRAREAGVLKLDGNEGAPPARALLEQLAQVDLSLLRDYPDPGPLAAEIAEELGVDAEQVVVTAGADDALDRICRAYLRPGRKALLPIPTFEMMYRFVQATGGEIQTLPWSGAFPTGDVIDSIDDSIALIAMISPNNPTGRAVTADDLSRVSAAARGAIVLLDHVYVDYADEDLTPLASGLDNVVVVRTFSKAWGLAGCRVGYAVAPPEVAAVIRNAGNPYPVSGLSIEAVRTRLRGDRTPFDAHVKRVRDVRGRLADILQSLGTPAAPSQGNFVFVELGDRADFVEGGLTSLGVAVRRFRHRSEIANGLRVSLTENEDDLDRLETALRTVLDPEALLFDLDGVLADVEQSYRRCVIETAESFGARITRSELDAEVHNGDANNDWILTQRILAGRGIDVPLVDVTARFQELYLGTPERDGLREQENLLVDREWLERLASRLPLGIVTGRPREEAEWFLKRAGIAGLFKTVVCMEDGKLKPDPEPVRIALSAIGLARVWMVGDTPDDIRAAKAAGVIPLGVVAPGDDPDGAGQALRDAGAALVLNTISNLEDLLS